MKKNCLEEYHICLLNVCQSHAFIDSSCLVKETIGKVVTLEKTRLRVITLNMVFSKGIKVL